MNSMCGEDDCLVNGIKGAKQGCSKVLLWWVLKQRNGSLGKWRDRIYIFFLGDSLDFQRFVTARGVLRKTVGLKYQIGVSSLMTDIKKNF